MEQFTKVMILALKRGYLKNRIFSRWQVNTNLSVMFYGANGVFTYSFYDIIFDIEFLKAYFGTHSLEVEDFVVPQFIKENEDVKFKGLTECWAWHSYNLLLADDKIIYLITNDGIIK